MKKTLAMIVLTFCFSAAAIAAPELTDAERTYHDKIFDYVMDNIEAGKNYDWASYSGKGTINVGAPFISKSKSNCREFSEDFTIQGEPGLRKGVACRRTGDNNGWCSLKSTDLLSCALEKPGYLIGGGTYSVPTPNVNLPDMPNVSVGGIGNVGSVNVNVNAPNLHAPSLSGSGSGNRGQQPNNTSRDGNKGGEASGTAYTVTDTLGQGAAKGTGAALSWFNQMFR